MIIKKDDPFLLKKVTDVLQSDGIAIIPCDTMYGIVGKVPATEERIRFCKGREDKPFIRLISNAERIREYTDISVDKRILSLWPGPLTLILPGKKEQTYALRVPDDPFLTRIFDILHADLFSTSVNISGQKPLWKIKEIAGVFSKKVDLIIDDGNLEKSKPSTILDITKHPYQILRQGECKIPYEIPTAD